LPLNESQSWALRQLADSKPIYFYRDP
jgi:hypothetical protein